MTSFWCKDVIQKQQKKKHIKENPDESWRGSELQYIQYTDGLKFFVLIAGGVLRMGNNMLKALSAR